MFSLLKDTANLLYNKFTYKSYIKIATGVIIELLISACNSSKIYVLSSFVNKVSSNTDEVLSEANTNSALALQFICSEALLSFLPYIKYHLAKDTEEVVQKDVFERALSFPYIDSNTIINDRNAKELCYKKYTEAERYGLSIFTLVNSQLIPTTIDIITSYLILGKINNSFYFIIPIYCSAKFTLTKKIRDIVHINERLNDVTNTAVLLNQKITTDIENIQLITLSNKSSTEYSSLVSISGNYVSSQFKYEGSNNQLTLYDNLVNLSIKCTSLYFFSGTKSFYSDMIVYLMYIDKFDSQIKALSGCTESLYNSVNSIKNLPKAYTQQVSKFEHKIVNTPKDIIAHHDFSIVFKNVSFRYNKNSDFLLKDINFIIEPFKTTGILGVSGAGKSTIVKLICNIVQPEKGNIYINGKNIKTISKHSLYKIIGVLTQNNRTFDDRTVQDNIYYSQQCIPKQAKKEASKILKRVGLFNVKTDQLCYYLSGGQKQRVGLGRVIAQQPKIIILDEYTSELDSFTESMVMETFKDLSFKKTALIVGHRIATMQDADKIIVIGENGRIIQQGHPQKLLADKQGFYYKSLMLQTNMGTRVLKNELSFSK